MLNTELIYLSNCEPESKITLRFLACELTFSDSGSRVLIVVEELSVGQKIRTTALFWFSCRHLFCDLGSCVLSVDPKGVNTTWIAKFQWEVQLCALCAMVRTKTLGAQLSEKQFFKNLG